MDCSLKMDLSGLKEQERVQMITSYTLLNKLGLTITMLFFWNSQLELGSRLVGVF